MHANNIFANFMSRKGLARMPHSYWRERVAKELRKVLVGLYGGQLGSEVKVLFIAIMIIAIFISLENREEWKKGSLETNEDGHKNWQPLRIAFVVA